jgi:hypothetical protein
MLPWVVLVAVLATTPLWALTAAQQAGVDRLADNAVASLTTGKPDLWSLFSTQGSAALIATPDGYALASRLKLKNKPEVAAPFRLPAGVRIMSATASGAGQFAMGRVTLRGDRPAAVRPAPAPKAPANQPWDTFWRGGPLSSEFSARPQAAPAPVRGPRPYWWLDYSAVRDGPQGTWRFVSFALMPAAGPVSAADAQGLESIFRMWELAFTKGDLQSLAPNLNPDPFCAAFYTPDGQGWYFTAPQDIIVTLSGLLSMGASAKSTMTQMESSVSGRAATVTSRWSVEIPMYGTANMTLSALLVKPADRWLLVSLCAGETRP